MNGLLIIGARSDVTKAKAGKEGKGLVLHQNLKSILASATCQAVAFFGFIWGPTGMLLSVPMMTCLDQPVS